MILILCNGSFKRREKEIHKATQSFIITLRSFFSAIKNKLLGSPI